MTDATDLPGVDGATAANLKRLVLEELSGEIMLDQSAVDAIVRGIVCLLRGDRRNEVAPEPASPAE